MSRPLVGRIPRAFKSHKNPEGWAYGAYVRAKLARLGPLPADARPTLREAGVMAVDLERLTRELLAARTRQERRRLRRDAKTLRALLLAYERRLEELAGRHGSGPNIAEVMARYHAERPRG